MSVVSVLGWIGALLVALIAAAAGYTAVRTQSINATYPPIGEFIDVDGAQIHYTFTPGPEGAVPVLFLHGASGSLRDWHVGPVEGLARHRGVIALDRPGLGWSERGDADDLGTPDGQARVAARVLERLEIPTAVIVGHSYGAAVAAALALDAPERVAGLVLLAPATHPWPGGVAWYHHAATLPVIGPLFRWTIGLPAGEARLSCATQSVFEPNPPVPDYAERTGAARVLTPSRFRANSDNVASLKAFVIEQAPRYASIAAPTMIFAGAEDTVVRNDLHAEALEREIANAGLVVLDNVGHMPQHGARDDVIAGIERLAAAIDQGAGVDAQFIATAISKGASIAVLGSPSTDCAASEPA